eukprot:Blabericola_migrator_1__1479@NODE_1391_length_4634_cov_199_307642_g931_i0_p2_GENE_NODE_1391_length_4634_cov_199_307642_g931_i0NODE_1391_length_4634_cov_199_307642_g931_i0_p2_ORF_typecomplete_len418_score90_37Aminotran_3/PF00202_21/7_7e127Aminotran_1_2/PF00155_21/3_3e10Cys_Met_Meta_PP/PF01053_20/0_00056Beta_elim_lyase/PF01212_21/0_002Aminotran_5/PF00266_19/0_0091DegT_DnrJ_EryC1/PF01041_17/0_85DegT_DnrJ_EryC1/PF01041_17/61ETF/PF01012_21/7_3e03ETF/PF01012_21/0_22_NODE_1391_length_4634_cov_199_30764
MTLTAQECMDLENRYGAHNYHPMPVVLAKGEGVRVEDVDGKSYYDFLSAYSAVNQGHRHPKIIQALKDQADRLTLCSRAFYSDNLGQAEKHITQLLGYDKALFMNSGAEAVETGIKLARRYAYDVLKIPQDEAVIITAKDNFHGRTTTIVSFSTDPESYGGYGPKMPGFVTVPYNDLEALEAALKSTSNVVAYLVEPIQGEAGIAVPDEGYLKRAAELCKAHNVLLIADEVQTGLCRTGKMLACEYEGVRPDILLLGKALSGGVLPVSCALADDHIMLCIKPGQHGSTFGGNPLACAVAMAALDVLVEEKLAENATLMGELFRNRMNEAQKRHPGLIKCVRGRGLLNAIVINSAPESDLAWEICLEMAKRGLVAKPTHGNIIRFAPPLIINETQMLESCQIIEEAFAFIAAGHTSTN